MWLPERPNQRYFKFRLRNNTWKTLLISNKKELGKFLKKYNPIDSYYSKGRFVNPGNVDKNKKYYLIKKDTIIDLDNTSLSNAEKCVDLFKNKIKYIGQTSKNSLQISVDENEEKTMKILKKNKIDFCNSVFNSDKIVVRLIGTFHYNNFKTRFLNKDLDRFEGCEKKEKIQKEKKEYWFSFIRQKLDNVNNCYVVFFKYPSKERKISNNLMRRIRYLQNKNLGDVYIIDYIDDGYLGILFPRIVDYKKLLILYGKKKFLIRTTEKRFKKKIYARKPEPFIVIKSPTKGDYSKPHCDFLRQIGFDCKYPNEIGEKRAGYGRFFT